MAPAVVRGVVSVAAASARADKEERAVARPAARIVGEHIDETILLSGPEVMAMVKTAVASKDPWIKFPAWRSDGPDDGPPTSGWSTDVWVDADVIRTVRDRRVLPDDVTSYDQAVIDLAARCGPVRCRANYHVEGSAHE